MLQTHAVKKQPSLFKTILLAGLIAGTSDALFAIADFTVSRHANPVIIFWYIASGAFGSASSPKVLITADISTQFIYAAAGVLLHYFIAYTFITVLFFLFPLFNKILANVLLIAVVYGIIVWLVMNYIVLPLAFAGQFPVYTVKTILSVSYLIVAIGLAGSLFAGRFYQAKNARAVYLA
ncbi:MAG TPA: hypothetical protein VG738_00055 [Chitinophagaceae bacterium]|nr:hypothetical protein [Chitinophagaceae bacterium]